MYESMREWMSECVCMWECYYVSVGLFQWNQQGVWPKKWGFWTDLINISSTAAISHEKKIKKVGWSEREGKIGEDGMKTRTLTER